MGYPVPQGSVGSNPTPRTLSLKRDCKEKKRRVVISCLLQSHPFLVQLEVLQLAFVKTLLAETQIPCRRATVGSSSRRSDAQQGISANLARRPCTGSFACGLQNASGKSRCHIRSSASQTVCSRPCTCLSACCSHSFSLVLQKMVFAALAVASCVLPQGSEFVWRCIN
jgi:hypothetical protein